MSDRGGRVGWVSGETVSAVTLETISGQSRNSGEQHVCRTYMGNINIFGW